MLPRVYGGPLNAMGAYMMAPGARLKVGPRGHLYETMGESNGNGNGQSDEDVKIADKANKDAAKAAAKTDEAHAAKVELDRMRGSLKGWLKYRGINDEVATGKRKARIPAFLAAQSIARDRDYAGEQKLADDLYLLLSRLYPAGSLPAPDVGADSEAAVKLAAIAIDGKPAEMTPTPTGIFPLVLLAVGGVVLFTITSYISNRAEVQKEKERLACIQAGACTDYGFWLKAASVIVVGYFVWEKLGVGERVKGAIKKK